MRKKVLMIILLFVSVLVISGCRQEEKDVYSGEAGKINIYMSGPSSLARQLEEAFEEGRGDVIEVLNASGGSISTRIWAELEAGEIRADVVLAGEPSMFISLRNKGALENYVSPETDNMQEKYNFGEGYFTPVNARYGIIVYNVDKVGEQEIPTSWAELKLAHWNNRIALPDPTQSATAFGVAAGIEQVFNRDWTFFEAMMTNNAMLVTRNSLVAQRVKTGEVDAGFMVHDGVLRSINKDAKEGVESPLRISWPTDKAVSIQRPIGIIANNSRPDENVVLTHEFVDFVLSIEGQNIMRKFAFISVRTDIDLPKGVPANLESILVDWEHVSDNQETIRARFQSIISG